MESYNLMVQGDPEYIKDLNYMLQRNQISSECLPQEASPDQCFHDLAVDVAVIIVTIVGGIKPLLSALVDFHRTHSARNANKEIRITIEGKSIDLKGFDDNEIRRLTNWLSKDGD